MKETMTIKILNFIVMKTKSKKIEVEEKNINFLIFLLKSTPQGMRICTKKKRFKRGTEKKKLVLGRIQYKKLLVTVKKERQKNFKEATKSYIKLEKELVHHLG